MKKNSYYSRILSFFTLLIILSTFLPQIFQNKFQLSATLQADEEFFEQQDEFEMPGKVEENIIDIDFIPDSINDSTAIYGEGLRITNNKILVDEYAIALGPNDTIHCIWLQQITHLGLSLMYSYSNDSVNWLIPEVVFRLYTTVILPQLLIDTEGGIHIVFYAYRTNQYRLYYFQSPSYNLNFSNELIYDSLIYEIDELALVLTHNDTVNVVWKSQTYTSSSVSWDSQVVIARLNLTTGLWLSEPWVLFNESNPIFIGVSSTYDSLRICWSRSTNFIADYYLIYSQYNETTKSWNAHSEIATSENKIAGVFIFPKISGGNFILWVERPKYYIMCYGELLESETLINVYKQFNANKTSSYHATIVEDSFTHDVHLVYEQVVSLKYSLYQRKLFASNSSWSEGLLLSTNDYSKHPDFYIQSKSSTLIAILFYLSDGSIVSSNYSISETFSVELLIYFGGSNFYYQSVVIDSEGISHLICHHKNRNVDEIVYQKKFMNETLWTDFTSIINGLYDITNTNLLIDENDTLFMFYISIDTETSRTGIFMMVKNKYQNNWSSPKLLFTPTESINLNEESSIFFDEQLNLHAFWVQYNLYSEIYEIGYSMKPYNEENFTNPISLPTYQEDSHNYQLHAIAEPDGTLHLANVEYSESYQVTSIIYRSKNVGEDWVNPSIVFASYNLMARPKLISDSEGNLDLILTDSLVISHWQDIYDTDFRSLSKAKGGYWVDNGIFLYETGSAAYYDVIVIDEEFYMVYYELDAMISYWHATTLDYLKIIKRTVTGQWTDDRTLFYHQMDKTLPVFAYNDVTEELSIFFEMTDYINWIVLQNDTDQDGLGDLDEKFYQSDPLNPDTDGDGLQDGFEVKGNYTNPVMYDTDWDDLSDGEEILIYKCDPLKSDTDRDNLRDGVEVLIYGTDPTTRDTDKDLLNDDIEIFALGSNPLSNDTDGDGMDDHFEYFNSLLILIDDSLEDPDEDNLSNIDEYLIGTGIYNPDSDLDLLSDGAEVHIHGTNPLDADTDADTLTDWEEIMKYHTSPFLEDTDSDGFSDRDEILAGTDPNDPTDNLRSKQLRIVLIASIVPVISVISLVIFVEVRYRTQVKNQKESEQEELKKVETIIDEMKKND